MNKTQLIEQLKQPEDKVNSLLSAAAIAADLKDYSKDQLKTLQTIHQLVESGKAKTYKAAAEIYHQQTEFSTKSSDEELLEKYSPFIQEQAKKAAELSLSILPAMIEAEHNRLQEEFVKAYRKHVVQQIQDPEYRKRFEAEMLERNLGKSRISSTTTSPIALPGSSSSIS